MALQRFLEHNQQCLATRVELGVQLQRAERQTTAGWNVETLQFLLRWSRSFGACVQEELEAAGSSGVAPEKSSGSRASAADTAGSESGAAPEEGSGSRVGAADTAQQGVAQPKRRGQRGGKHKDYYEKWFYVPPEKRRSQR